MGHLGTREEEGKLFHKAGLEKKQGDTSHTHGSRRRPMHFAISDPLILLSPFSFSLSFQTYSLVPSPLLDLFVVERERGI